MPNILDISWVVACEMYEMTILQSLNINCKVNILRRTQACNSLPSCTSFALCWCFPHSKHSTAHLENSPAHACFWTNGTFISCSYKCSHLFGLPLLPVRSPLDSLPALHNIEETNTAAHTEVSLLFLYDLCLVLF